MYFKHFLKRLISFILIVGLGIIALFAINMYQKSRGEAVVNSNTLRVPER